MPLLPGKSCRIGSCPHITRNKNGYCDDHQSYAKAYIKNYEKRPRENALTPDNFYQSSRWIRFRNWYRKKHPTCKQCWEEGRGPVPMKIVDHIIPIEAGGKMFSESNARSLCQECHNRKTKEDQREYNL
ncbi:MAG: HNH endonuclease signature motif containing protein [Nitrosarchaeum sp.]